MYGSVCRLFLRFRSVDKSARGPLTSRSATPPWVLGAAPTSTIPRVASPQAHLTVFGPRKEFFQ
jgi:hypothetical protein